MPQNQQITQIMRLKGSFNRALPKDKYKLLVHFVVVTKLQAHVPGKYTCYRFYKNYIGVATSEPNINEWLELHDIDPRATVNPKFNGQGKVLAQAHQNGFTKFGGGEGVMQTSEQLQDEIMRMLNSGYTLTSIGHKLGCTVPNVHYHRKKYMKRMHPELEVDNQP
jgi:hypothetical protein|tara:strand:- start:5962 stop:6456 length:495 start_codon:yes stop_codon:yes gene_type:complete